MAIVITADWRTTATTGITTVITETTGITMVITEMTGITMVITETTGITTETETMVTDLITTKL